MLEDIPEEDVPELFVNPDVLADELIIVKPKDADFQGLEGSKGGDYV